MDELTRDLALAETVAASDALNNAIMILEEAAQGVWPEHVEDEQWTQILNYAVSALHDERGRRAAEYLRLREY
jgi:hypothetical protein